MTKVDILGVAHDYEITLSQHSSEITLVFIHGWLLSRQYWAPIIDWVSADFSCLSYDLRGFGNSTYNILNREPLQFAQSFNSATSFSPFPNDLECGKIPIASFAEASCQASHYSPAAYGQDLLVLLKELNIKRPWLVGHSLGGTIALWAAAMSSLVGGMETPIIEGIICLNSGGGLYIHEDFEKFRSVGQQILKFRPPWLSRVPGLDWVFSRGNVASAVDRQWGKQLLQDFIQADMEAGQRALLDSTTPEEVLCLPKLVQGLKQPAYFIAGRNDQVMEPKFVRHLASFHPLFSRGGKNIIELSNCGHLGMIEQPQQISEVIQQAIHQHSYSIQPEQNQAS